MGLGGKEVGGGATGGGQEKDDCRESRSAKILSSVFLKE